MEQKFLSPLQRRPILHWLCQPENRRGLHTIVAVKKGGNIDAKPDITPIGVEKDIVRAHFIRRRRGICAERAVA